MPGICEYVDCQKQANFAFDGNKALYCATHRLEKMVNVTQKRCEHNGCKKQPYFAYHGNKASYCVTHRLAGMVDVLHKCC